MDYFAGFYGISGNEAISRSSTLLRSVGLEGSEKMKIRAYSQGMKKRFSLAASMLGDPQNFLFDEVLNGLSISSSFGTQIPISPATYGLTSYSIALAGVFWVLVPAGLFLYSTSRRD